MVRVRVRGARVVSSPHPNTDPNLNLTLNLTLTLNHAKADV